MRADVEALLALDSGTSATPESGPAFLSTVGQGVQQRLAAGMHSGALTPQQGLQWARHIEKATGQKLLGTLSDAEALASADAIPRALSHSVLAEVLGRTPDGQRTTAGGISRRLDASDPQQAALGAVFSTFRNYLGTTLGTAAEIHAQRKAGAPQLAFRSEGPTAGNTFQEPHPQADKPETKNIQADLDIFSDDWKPPGNEPLGPTLETVKSADHQDDSITDIRRSRDVFGEDEEPYYWTEYYRKAGREKDNLETLIESLQQYNELMKGKPNHFHFKVEEDKDGASLKEAKDKAGNISYIITHGPMTKKWEMLEEFAHFRARHGWKKEEIKAVKEKLDRRVLLPDGKMKRPARPSDAAEEIVVKQHLLDHATSLSDAERQVLQEAIKQLYMHGLRYRY